MILSTAKRLDVEDQNLIEAIKQKATSDDEFNECHPIYPPATLHEVQAVEAAIGLKLPEFMRELYLQVGSGGFGPAGGIASIRDENKMHKRKFIYYALHSVAEIKAHLLENVEYHKCADPIDTTAINWYQRLYTDWEQIGTDRLIWYCDWGCNMVTVVDPTRPGLPVYWVDSLVITQHTSKTLRQWWRDWLNGTLRLGG